MSVKELLEAEVSTRMAELKDCKPGTEDYDNKVTPLTKLMDRYIELEKHSADVAEQEKRRHDDKKDRIVKNVMNGVKDAAIIGVTIWGTVIAMNFEREGTFTTSAGRKHVNKVLSWFK